MDFVRIECARLELMEIVTEDTPSSDPNYVELDLLADLADEYEMEHYPIGQLTLADVLKLRMGEMHLRNKYKKISSIHVET